MSVVDVLTPEQRKFNMRRIKGQDTRLELMVRRELHARGFRFRLHRKDLPGSPDLVFPKYRVCLFVNGCFWHGHDCNKFKLPTTRREFWENKITGNRERDRRVIALLNEENWRVLTVWECAIRGAERLPMEDVIHNCITFMQFETSRLASEIRSNPQAQ
ncbi:very short patch repair endonuclease [Kordiimonas aestuarii]|uniref:very short patch repair endonuclease n=1 Tax=Kordiimonas aestuarii TaxID=1005925 RepID=UPI00374DC6EB